MNARSKHSGVKKIDSQFSKVNLDKIIRRLFRAFLDFPNLFLTEEDIRCHLFSELLRVPQFSLKHKTSDGSFSIPIHSEVRWYGASNKLKYRSDIVILDPGDLRVMETKLKLPTKGYAFNYFWAIIEIKLRRKNGKSDNQFLKDIIKEKEKLISINEEIIYKDRAYYCVLCFDKKKDISKQIKKIKDDNLINLKYVFCDK